MQAVQLYSSSQVAITLAEDHDDPPVHDDDDHHHHHHREQHPLYDCDDWHGDEEDEDDEGPRDGDRLGLLNRYHTPPSTPAPTPHHVTFPKEYQVQSQQL